MAGLCNMLFYAASLLVPYYLLAGLVKWLARPLRRRGLPLRRAGIGGGLARALSLR